ncbi:MAG: NUDIX domain-containing protein [Candidatus Falkowbacteria bacterium]|nr:NUDIX domain-containing protein [Candidatus Falkowbacteria bacterium]
MPEKDLYQVSLKLILKNDQGEILILKSLDDNGVFSGFYDLPGGRIDDNEFNIDFTDILKREVAEEIGEVKVSIVNKPVALGRAQSHRLNSRGTYSRVLYVFFEADYHAGDITISEEHLAYKWIKLDDVKIEDYFVSGILEGIKMYLDL